MRIFATVAAWAVLSCAAFAQTSDITAPPRAQLAPGESPSVALPGVIAHSRHVVQIENGRLAGEGGEFLRSLGARAQFVLIGEEHGNAAIADFAAAYWRDLSENGYRYAAIEVDPWTTAALERELRAGGADAWARFVASRGGAVAAPFFTWAPEARMAEAVVSTTPDRDAPTLWGLDQVFIGAAPWLLREIAAQAEDAQAREIAAALVARYDEAQNLSWPGEADAAPYIALRARLTRRNDRHFADLVDAMIVSQRIYGPFTGAGGEPWHANSERENLLRTLFLQHYREAERADGAPPRVMLKFGGYHMFRGASPTHVQALGGFVSEFAYMTGGGGALTIFAACGPGSSVSGFGNPAAACDDGFTETWGFLADSVDATGLTVFDLRVWRMRPRAWAHLPAEVRQFIDSYDLLVVAPNGAASEFLPGIAPPPSRGG